MKIPFKHILDNLEENPSIEEISNKLFQLGHEHEITNNIFDIEITPNRGDCLSLNGILRDLKVFYNLVSKNQYIYEGHLDEFNIEFENFSKQECPKISFLNVEIDDIPTEYNGVLKQYFKDLSLNKNNFFTDISNYISYETGQPTHCYDAKKINNEIIFREIQDEIAFTTLLNEDISLDGKNYVFENNNEIINLAGIMGGKNTACTENTKNVIVECAFFNPEIIIGKTLKYDIQSDAAYKFERGVDHNCHENVLRRFIKLIKDHSHVKNVSLKSFEYEDQGCQKVLVDIHKINKILGLNITREEYLNYLLKLGFQVKENFIYPASYRRDIVNQNDIAEEIARVIGYDQIPIKKIDIKQNSSADVDNEFEKKIKNFFIDNGFFEVINSPFDFNQQDDSIKIDNPIDSNKPFLRTSLTNNLLNNLLYNERRQKDSIKLFEISDIYSLKKNINKIRKLGLVISGRQGLNYKEFNLKLNEKYLKNLLKDFISNEHFIIQNISRTDLNTKFKNEIYAIEIELNKFSKNILDYEQIYKPSKLPIRYEEISDLPSSCKDLSYLIKNPHKLEKLETFIINYKNSILKDVFIFDYYNNENKNEIKIGFRFIFQSRNKTLTSEEIENALDDIINKSLEITEIEIPGLKK